MLGIWKSFFLIIVSIYHIDFIFDNKVMTNKVLQDVFHIIINNFQILLMLLQFDFI